MSLEALKAFAHRNPARIAALITSLVAVLVAGLKSDLPADALAILILSSLGLGEFAQRTENKKTQDALETDPAELEDAPADEE